MKHFHSHGDACEDVEKRALKLVNSGSTDLDEDNPLRPYNDMLEELGMTALSGHALL